MLQIPIPNKYIPLHSFPKQYVSPEQTPSWHVSEIVQSSSSSQDPPLTAVPAVVSMVGMQEKHCVTVEEGKKQSPLTRQLPF